MSLKLSDEDLKEAVEFFTRFGGSVTSTFEQMFFDWLYLAHPELATNPLFSRLTPDMPAYSNFLVSLGFNVAPWVAALFLEEDAGKKGDKNTENIARGVRQFTEGGVLYTVPRLIRIPEVNMISKAIPHTAATQSPPGSQQNPQQPTSVVYKL
jgi:hypothetical protein